MFSEPFDRLRVSGEDQDKEVSRRVGRNEAEKKLSGC
jgi:hypothetical protein